MATRLRTLENDSRRRVRSCPDDLNGRERGRGARLRVVARGWSAASAAARAKDPLASGTRLEIRAGPRRRGSHLRRRSVPHLPFMNDSDGRRVLSHSEAGSTASGSRFQGSPVTARTALRRESGCTASRSAGDEAGRIHTRRRRSGATGGRRRRREIEDKDLDRRLSRVRNGARRQHHRLRGSITTSSGLS